MLVWALRRRGRRKGRERRRIHGIGYEGEVGKKSWRRDIAVS